MAQLLISIPDLEYTAPRKQTCATLSGLMRRGIVPIVNENDAIASPRRTRLIGFPAHCIGFCERSMKL